MTIYTPPRSSTHLELPFSQVSWKEFELLCQRMIADFEGFGPQQMQVYGLPGQAQAGIDIYVRLNSGRFFTYQCKRYQKITPADLSAMVQVFRDGKWFAESDKFVLCISCSLDETSLCDRFEELRLALEIEGVLLEKWDLGYLNQFLKDQPKIVYQFFGEAWCRAFCGDRIFDQVIGTGLAQLAEINRDFKAASDALGRVSSYFGNGSIHIDRKETMDILAWCFDELGDDKLGLAVVQGGAGMGKTVVMKDVMQRLSASGVPVLAIKADIFQAANVPELEVLLFQNHSVHIIESVRTLLLQHRMVVVLIDQIDALSQSLTTNRAFINSYVGLVKRLLGIPGVRTIMSTRSFDLEYDGDLRTFKSTKYFQIKVDQLTAEQVREVIRDRGYSSPTEKLVKLLRTPNHLNIFCKLKKGRKLQPELITSQKELYDSFWSSLLRGFAFKKQFKELIYGIAIKMNAQGVIIVPNIYQDEDEALNFALSNQLLVEEPNGLQFFHQTFYEYVFARQFVEGKRDLIAFLDEQHQGIFIRSVVKLVTDYLRELDNELYVATLKALLANPATRYHLKLLLINGFARIQEPTIQEKALLEGAILTDRAYGQAFSHAIESDNWYSYLLSRGLMMELVETSFSDPDKTELRNWVASIISRHFAANTSATLDFWQLLEDTKTSQLSIGFLLTYVNNWEDPRLISYFEKYIIYDVSTDEDERHYSFYDILGKIALDNLPYVIFRLKPILIDLLSFELRDFGSDMEEDFLEKSFPLYPTEMSQMLQDVLLTCITQHAQYDHYADFNCPLFDSLLFTETSFYDHYSLSGKIVKLLTDHFAAVSSQDGFDAFFSAQYQSDSVVVLSLITEVLILAPQADKCLLLVETIAGKNGLRGWMDDFQKRLNRMTGLCYPLMNEAQQLKMNKILMSITERHELKVYEQNGEKKFWKAGGKQLIFIRSLPYELIVKYPDLKRRYFELHRSFNEGQDPPPVVLPELPLYEENMGKEIGFDHMNPQNWRSVFRKLDKMQEGGGYSVRMHRRFMDKHDVFSSQISKNPTAFSAVIEELYEQKSGYNIFLRAAFLGLVEAGADPAYLMLLYREMISRIKLDSQLADILRMFHPLAKLKCIDPWMIDWLTDLSLNHPDPDLKNNPEHPYLDQRNGIRPLAMKNLLLVFQQTEFSERIFNTAELVAVSDDHPTKLAVVTKFGNLAWIDEFRALSVLLNITLGEDEAVFKGAFLPVKRLMLKHKEILRPFFEHMVAFENLLTNEGLGLIVREYFEGNEDFARPYLAQIINHGNVIRARLITVTEGYLTTHTAKALVLLTEWLDFTGQDVAKSFAGLIIRKFKALTFDLIYPFLLRYAECPSVEKDFGCYFKHLIFRAGAHPAECLILLKKFKLEETTSKRFMNENGPMQSLLAIYTTFSKDKNRPRAQFEDLMDLFDRIIKFEGQRNSLDTIIEKMDS